MHTITTKIADRLLVEMNDGRAEGRARELVRHYRRTQTPEAAARALAALNSLPVDRQRELRAIVRI